MYLRKLPSLVVEVAGKLRARTIDCIWAVHVKIVGKKEALGASWGDTSLSL
jgi:hypothetical protein